MRLPPPWSQRAALSTPDLRSPGAYFCTITFQRWLGIRLDALGNILILAIGLFGIGYRLEAQPSKLGVVLTYSLTLTQIFSQLVSGFCLSFPHICVTTDAPLRRSTSSLRSVCADLVGTRRPPLT